MGSQAPKSSKPSKPTNQTPPSRSSSSSLSSHLAMIELKQRILTSLSKLSDRDTHQIAVEDLEKIIQTLSPDGLSMLLNCLYDATNDPKPAVKKESIRLLAALCAAHGDSTATHLTKIIAHIVKRLKDSDSGVRDSCRDAIGALSSQYLKGESGDNGGLGSVVSLFVKPLFEAMNDQSKVIQGGSAMCMAKMVDCASDPPIAAFQKLCPRICKSLNNPNFLAKAALLSVVSSLSHVCSMLMIPICSVGAIAPQSLESLLQSIHECLSSTDWATRKAAADTLSALALHSRNLITESAASTLTVLEDCRFDKLKAMDLEIEKKEMKAMDSEIEKTEMRLRSFLDQLQVEWGILDRMVYKNKNQHRRCSYFQYLLKVRSYLRLLQSARLEEILSSSFLVINGKRAKQKVQLLESLKRRKCDGKYNFLERLLGAARLLSQIVEPMLKAAMEISKVLARSFFMGFSLTIMALLARLRVLVQQILLDVVTVFNVASSLSRKEQSVKLTQDGLEVFRDLYPTNEQQAVYLECVWEADKFVLIERINEPENKDQVMDVGEDLSPGASAIQYQSIETLLGEDELDPNFIKEDDPSLVEGVANKTDDSKPVEDGVKVEDFSSVARTLSSSPRSNSLKRERGLRNKVAFISVKRPAPSTAG